MTWPVSGFDVAARPLRPAGDGGAGGGGFTWPFMGWTGKARPLTIGLGRGRREPRPHRQALRPKLEPLDPGFGIEVVTLAGEDVEPLRGADQRRLDSLLEADGGPGGPGRPAGRHAWGPDRVSAPCPAWPAVCPELSFAPAPALGVAAPNAPAWDPEQPRPLRLFRKPERLEGVMALTPDDPPRQFQWRRRTDRIRPGRGT